MKKFILFFSLFTLSFALNAQDIIVPQTNKPLIVKYTASWCPYCGAWGWTLFENLLTDNSSDATLVAAHYSGNYLNSTSLAWYNNDNAFYQPVFFVNDVNQNAMSGNIASVRDAVRQEVQEAKAQAPLAQAGIRAQVDDNYDVYVDVKTHFFNNASGEYYLGVYLVEKSFIGYQASIGNNAEHRQVLRGSISPGSFGALVASGDISAGSDYQVSYSIGQSSIQSMGIEHLDDLYSGDIEVVTVIWKKTNGKYQAVNANSSVLTILSAVEAPAVASRFDILPNIVAQQAEVQLELPHALPDSRLSLFSLNGVELRNLHRGAMPEGLNTFTLNRENLPAGIYLLQLSSGSEVVNRKAVFR
ncbi:MAG: hypothetical protein KDC66_07170 [Phaeodactylibacter sp.]|nr:hypothetical protein [Phaeodactylibacter sp.]MCB9275958.1 hypothetical protein [Lewinellaceae bacterium]